MAATENKKLIRALSSATCALLGTVPAAHAGKLDLWDLDASVLYYSEADGRVSAIEPVIELKKAFHSGQEATLKFTLDALTGATPNGATATNVAQTFTRPSGNESYVVQPGEVPLDDTFHDTRVAVNGSWKQPLNRLTSATIGANFSKEFDFTSMGGSLQLSRDFNQKNTTVVLGLSTEFDTIEPVGNVPIPFASMAPAGTLQPKQGSSESKKVLDGLLGITQIINPRMLMQINYSLSKANGYMNDPYKVISVIDPGTGSTQDNVYENRPDNRLKHALFWLTRYHLGRDVASGSYRYFMDDWGVKSHTVDLTYNWKYAETKYLEPRFRFYSQSEADFYTLNLYDGNPLPQEASADYRLAQMHGFTYGLKWGWLLKNESEIVLRLEYYNQIGDSSPSSAIGVQQGLDLYPDTKALITQLQFRF